MADMGAKEAELANLQGHLAGEKTKQDVKLADINEQLVAAHAVTPNKEELVLKNAMKNQIATCVSDDLWQTNKFISNEEQEIVMCNTVLDSCF
jgi:hypothetical protein